MPLAASITGILSAGQANVDSQAARAKDSAEVEDSAEVGKVVDSVVADSGGNLTVTLIRIRYVFNQSRKRDYICVREEKNEYMYMV
jgi:hypothetical protein